MVSYIDRMTYKAYEVIITRRGRDITRDCVNEMDEVLGYDCEVETYIEYLKKFYNAKVKEV